MIVNTQSLPPDGLHQPEELASLAKLLYVTDEMPGIRRQRRGRGFTYLDPHGKRVTDPRERERIESLAIPPAWTDVWICPLPNGHLQATGRDDQNRKQYRYHPRWHEFTNQSKFERMLPFGRTLPRLRRQIQEDLSLRPLCRRKVVAAVVAVLDQTLLRVGNKAYAEENDSFGVTTLTDNHVRISGPTVRFRFRGKGGKLFDTTLHDRRLARIIHKCEEIPGQELFQFRDEDGAYRVVSSADVNEYLWDVTAQQFTAKDFRTWRGTALAVGHVWTQSTLEQPIQKKALDEAIKHASRALGNTCSVCRKFYVNVSILELFRSGQADSHLKSFRFRKKIELSEEEQILLHLLQTSA